MKSRRPEEPMNRAKALVCARFCSSAQALFLLPESGLRSGPS
jgi:hypothetical protein